MAAILSKFFVFCLFSYFVVYFLKFKLILFYKRVANYYIRIFLILLPHLVWSEFFCWYKMIYLVTEVVAYFLLILVCLLKRHRIHLLHPPLQRSKNYIKRGVLDMTLNCNWWWGSNTRYLRSMKYLFIAINPRFTLTQSDCMSYLWVKLICLKMILILLACIQKKKNVKLHKNVNMNVQRTQFPWQVDMPLKSIN